MYDILNVYLENGLRVVLHRMPNIKTISCGVFVKQGSKHENNETNGLSHLIEHLMINIDNDANPSFQKLMRSVTSEGVKYNAVTSKESTSYFFTGLSEVLPKCIETLASIVIDSKTFGESLLEKEKKVVAQEAITFYSSFNQIKERVSQALWGDVGIGKIILGNIENVNKANLHDLEKIIFDSYTPENSIVVVIGDFQYQDALNIVQENFSRWKDEKTRESDDFVESEPGIYYNKGNNGKSAVISIGFRTSGYMNKDRLSLETMSKMMGEPCLESRLINEIRTKRGLAYSLGTFTNSYENRGTFAFTVVCSQDSVEEVIKVTMEEFNRFKHEGFSQEEMERAKRILKTSRLLEMGDITSQLKFLGKCATYGHLYSLEQELRNIEKIEIDSVKRVSKEIITEDNLSLAMIGNYDLDRIIPLLKIS